MSCLTFSPGELTVSLITPSSPLLHSENYAKSAAVYTACQKNEADILVGTRYTVTTTDYIVFKVVKCEVAGFPAVMSGVVQKKPYVLGNGKLVWLAEKPVVVK